MKLNRTRNTGVAHWREERPTNGLRFNSNDIMGNRITNSHEIMEKLHNKEQQLYFANGDSRKKKMLRQVFLVCSTNISQI